MWKIWLIGCLLAATAVDCLCQSTGLQGRVVLDGGPGLAGATISLRKIRDMPRDGQGRVVFTEPPLTATAISNAAGDFTFANLRPGSYSLCARGPGKQHLKSCQWMQPFSPVQVFNGRIASGVTLNVRTGVLVNFVVQDLGGGLRAGRRFRIGVYTDRGAYYHANPPTLSGNEYTYSLAVPKEASIRLFLDADVQVRNESAQLLQNRAPSQPITLPTSGETAVRLSVQ
ncbi:MAG: carboxypeptidase regulatory-like domain-containing protein [Acidobacteria bacterium]|nr:carboxypeptidase regulatory-like domain-containing protein [Acidobacteriota bacterium]